MARCAGVLTKDEGLADEFYLEALACCVTALRLAEHDVEGTGTRTAALGAIKVSQWRQSAASMSNPSLAAGICMALHGACCDTACSVRMLGSIAVVSS